MEIGSNTTGMRAGLTIATDKFGSNHCVVVVKGTFDLYQLPQLSAEQEPVHAADVYFGDPGESALKYDCDYALTKPKCDVLLNGSAYAPNGRPATSVRVSLQVGSLAKSFDVIGDRVWHVGLTIHASDPEAFTVMPISYGNAFGGIDQLPGDEPRYEYFADNPVGIGFHKHLESGLVAGSPLPNTQESGAQVLKPDGSYRPMALGAIPRNWASRARHAGTYGEAWLRDVFPFLPPDFDDRYFQAAPTDQQIPFCLGGERVRCRNLTQDGLLDFAIPSINVPVRYRFVDRFVDDEPHIDTVIIEPDLERLLVIWRTSIKLGRKIHDLKEVLVGQGANPSLFG